MGKEREKDKQQEDILPEGGGEREASWSILVSC